MEGNLMERDQIVLGRIVAIGEREIVLDVDGRLGIVEASDIDALPEEVREQMKVGDDVYAYVVEPLDGDGGLVLSLSRAVDEKDWRYVEELLVGKQALEMTITEANKGGVIIRVGRLRGFVPGSQLSDVHQRMLGGAVVEAEVSYRKLVGEKALVKVVEIDRKRNRLILSERASVKEARVLAMDKLMASITPGQVVDGFVSNVKDFGVFVDLGGADGMIHVSELSHESIGHPSEVVRKGQLVTVKVLSVDMERGRIVLSLKAMQGDAIHPR